MKTDKLRQIIYLQYPPLEEFPFLDTLADERAGAKTNVMFGFLCGVIRGKQMERARRKKRRLAAANK